MHIYAIHYAAIQGKSADYLQLFPFLRSLVSYYHPSRKMATELKFSDLEPALSSESLAAVASFGFTCMTPVQASSIPYFLKNKVRYREQDAFDGKIRCNFLLLHTGCLC